MIKQTVFILCVLALAAALHLEPHHEQAGGLYPGKVTIRAYTNNYLTRCTGCGPNIAGLVDSASFHQSTITGPWAYWQI